jgi:hypothetical protein
MRVSDDGGSVCNCGIWFAKVDEGLWYGDILYMGVSVDIAWVCAMCVLCSLGEYMYNGSNDIVMHGEWGGVWKSTTADNVA